MELIGKEIVLTDEFVMKLNNPPKKNKVVVIAITNGSTIAFRPYYSKDIVYTTRLNEFMLGIDNSYQVNKKITTISKPITTITTDPIVVTTNPIVTTTNPIVTTTTNPIVTEANTIKYVGKGFMRFASKSSSTYQALSLNDLYGGLYG